jgi:putative heme-binding domain-containing protein
MRIHNTIALFALGFVSAVVLTTSTPRAQQHSYTQQQIDGGRALYDGNCGRCHNDDGAGVPGVELFKQFKRANSDEDIAKLIQAGIPGTSMPSHQFTTEQAMNVVAYLRSMVGVTPTTTANAGAGSGRASSLVGDAARGKIAFDGKGGCTSCHTVDSSGGKTGPDLGPPPARAGGPGGPGGGGRGGRGAAPPTAAALERSILEPDADVAPAYRVFQVVTKNGQTVRGTLLNQDTFSLQLRDQSGELRAFQKSDLKDHGFQPSPMPSYRGRLTPQEVADVVAYLMSLRAPR